MSLKLDFFNRPSNITAKVICDSINSNGQRITTLEIEYPRYILGELNTHRQLSKNSSSSRAIPIEKMINQIENNPATPLYWGSAKSGMQAGDEVDDVDYCDGVWLIAMQNMIGQTNLLDDEKVHKQISNRLLEPFQMMKTVITGTDWDNFFNLRLHKDAQPEICMLAYRMYQAINNSTPFRLKSGEYHLPYINRERFEVDDNGEDFKLDSEIVYFTGTLQDGNMSDILTLEEAIKISAAKCAAVSYRTEIMTLEKANKIFEMLINAEVIHASPFEHLATPVPTNSVLEEKGITHTNCYGVFCSGNLTDWISYRHLLPNNTCYKFDFDKRMKEFE